RTGVLGFTAYASVLFLIVRYLAKAQRAMYWGFIGVLFYGLFHETFKESQGACLLAFLIGVLAQAYREGRQRAAAAAAALPVATPPVGAEPQAGLSSGVGSP